MTSAFKKLTKKEKKHLKENGVSTLAQFKDLRVFQLNSISERIKKDKEWHPGLMEPCWDCKMIARKLGLETVESQRLVVDTALKSFETEVKE